RAEAAAYEADHTLVAAEAQRYRDLALAATFADELRRGRDEPVTWHELDGFDLSHDLLGVSRAPLMTVAIMRRRRRVVLIEWLDRAATATREAAAKAEKTALMLQTPHPRRLLLPDCYGMVVDRHAGLV